MTYYEIWQQEKYGNILINSNQQPNDYETERYFKSSIDASEIDYRTEPNKNDGKLCSKDV